ncbi:putative ATP-grasp-modified RiPP [Nonomuraea sp. NPDC023979]|uniref:putative ATP-grasp-modified RiPP n=1 Tax=Nonomuraea sp. NPDC023979 TaxID=3154796 RepID=UPI0033C4F6C1
MSRCEDLVKPWGLGRITVGGPAVRPAYERVCIDPSTQITHFYDAGGAVLPIQMGATVTVSKGGGGDGSGSSAEVADDSQNDN